MSQIIALPEKKLRAADVWPYQFQLDCVAEMVSTPHKKIYNTYEQGLGKSAMAVMYANTVGARDVIVVTTASLRLNWAKEYQLWSIFNDLRNIAYVVLDGNDAQKLITRQKIHGGNLPSPIIVSYNMLVSHSGLRKYVMDRHWDLVIADEFHQARTLKTQTSQIMGRIISKAPRFLGLSGTPLCNSAADLIPALWLMAQAGKELLHPHDYTLCTDPKLFADTFTWVRETKYGTRYTGVKNQEKLRKLLVKDPPWAFRRLKRDVMQELPPITFDRVDLDLGGKTSVDKEATEYVGKFEKSNESFQGGPNSRSAGIMAVLRRELGQQLVSCPQTYEVIESAIESDGCVIVGAFHRGAIKVMEETLRGKGYTVGVVSGETNPRARQDIVTKFQNGELQVFIGQIKAAGTGLNLSRAQQVIMVEIDWLPDVINQFIARPHRIGQKGNVIARFLCTKSDIHKRILSAVIRKQKAFDYVVDGILPDSHKQKLLDASTRV